MLYPARKASLHRYHAEQRRLYRELRGRILERAMRAWPGTRAALKRLIGRMLKPCRKSFVSLRRALRQPAMIASIAAAVLAGGVSGPAGAVELSDVAAGSGGFIINGMDGSDGSGWSVSGAGDVNGDGLADLIVGAYGADPDGKVQAGESYVVFGKDTGTTVSLADVASGTGGFIINGLDEDDRSGFSVSGAGDVNGDGLADLIVGAPFADPAGNTRAGESYVVFGKDTGTTVSLADIASGTGGFVITGYGEYDYSGKSVSGAGDVNGDGLADLVVGAPYAGSEAGKSYVVFGKNTGAAVDLIDVASGTGGFVINGMDEDDLSGWSVSGAGDVNGDGLTDLIVGARNADPAGNSNAGESYVIFGKDTGAAVDLVDIASGTGGFIINGMDEDDISGFSVSGAGDVNGDNLADLIVGAPFADPVGNSNAGESYVVFGKDTGTTVSLADIASGTGGFIINGIDQGDLSGFSVSGAGDVNGDGLADLVVGAPYADPAGTTSAGESYVVFGRDAGTAVNLGDLASGTGGFVINGIDGSDGSGWSVSGAGDVNGDGFADLIVGAYGADPGGNAEAGESYVIFGHVTDSAVRDVWFTVW